MNTSYRLTVMSTRHRRLASCECAKSGRARFARLGGHLLSQQVGALRFVYYAFWGNCFVTLCAEPLAPDGAPVELPATVRARLIRAFQRWMALTHPGWREGPDAAGILDWDLRTPAYAHRHWGYRQQFFRSGDPDRTVDQATTTGG
jgi:hypothetical protein